MPPYTYVLTDSKTGQVSTSHTLQGAIEQMQFFLQVYSQKHNVWIRESTCYVVRREHAHGVVDSWCETFAVVDASWKE